jgi:hypothetical protein
MGLMADKLNDELRFVLAVAAALRNEFGVEIDAHPGGEGTEAGTVNRAFRAVVRTMGVEAGEGLTTFVTHLLGQVALRRLTELAVRPEQAEFLVSSEPKLGDRWLAFLALAPPSVIDDLLNH